jgi:poly(beta-D-mannuronate) lyase
MLSNFEVSIEDTVIRDLTVNKFFNVIIVSKGTMADRIDISGSTFQDISGSVLKLDQETDDFGIYNAEYVDISSSVFERINGPVVDVYRGGTDESTFGPHFKLTNSLISEVGAANNSGASVVLHGVQVADIHNNRFVGSASIRVNHTVAEPKTSIFNNNFKATGAPVIVELNSALPQTALVFDNTFHD